MQVTPIFISCRVSSFDFVMETSQLGLRVVQGGFCHGFPWMGMCHEQWLVETAPLMSQKHPKSSMIQNVWTLDDGTSCCYSNVILIESFISLSPFRSDTQFVPVNGIRLALQLVTVSKHSEVYALDDFCASPENHFMRRSCSLNGEPRFFL